MALTEQQVKNWRKVLAMGPIGAYALIMPVSEIERMKDLFQAAAKELEPLVVEPREPEAPAPPKEDTMMSKVWEDKLFNRIKEK